MKNTTSKHKRLKTSLALGASALGAASSHAAVVYWDTSGLSLSVACEYVDGSYDSLSISYDSASTPQMALGGTYDAGQSRGVLLAAKGGLGKDGKWSSLYIGPRGLSSTFNDIGAVRGKGISVGTPIGSSAGFSDSWGVDLEPDLTNFYVGIRLWSDDTGTNYNYGWASISTSADGLSATLNGIAFESDINTAINAGDTGMSAVPEPGNVVSLAALVGSAAFLRSRRKAAATAA